MLISRETDYAIRILRALQDGAIRSVPDVCESEFIPESFGYKIVRKLTRAGLIRTHRGATGGISLDGFNEKMTLWDLLQIMDDGLIVNACTADDYECAWRVAHGRCKVHERLCMMQKQFTKELEGVHLYQLVSPNVPQDPLE